MENLQKLMYVCLYAIAFAVAVAFLMSMLRAAQAKESVMVDDATDKASIAQQIVEKDNIRYVTVTAQEVFSTVLALADSGDQVSIYIGGSKISGSDMVKIRERKENVLQALRARIGSGNYRRINRFNSDLAATEIRFEGV